MTTALAVTAPDPPRIEWDEEGVAYDPDSGEVLGPEVLETLGDRLPDDARVGTIFVVSDRDTADWALEKRAVIESRLEALRARRDAYVANLDRQIRAEQRRLAWWEFRFWSGVVGVARSLLAGKSKTAQFDHGRVSFRTAPGSKEIVDMEAAVAWVRLWDPEKVKVTERVTATDVVKVREVVREETEAEGRVPLAFLVEGEPRESVTIRTGVAGD